MPVSGWALIVDDNLALARVTQFALQRAGFETEIALNGAKALELALARTFDVVISDQQMPTMTGLELCKRLRDLPQYASTPILLLTAKGLELDLPRIQRELNINAVFPKPFSPGAVVDAACSMLCGAT